MWKPRLRRQVKWQRLACPIKRLVFTQWDLIYLTVLRSIIRITLAAECDVVKDLESRAKANGVYFGRAQVGTSRERDGGQSRPDEGNHFDRTPVLPSGPAPARMSSFLPLASGLSRRRQPAAQGSGDLRCVMVLDEMARTGERHDRHLVVDPMPNPVESRRQGIGIVESVEQ
jgi:hypothetical protein